MPIFWILVISVILYMVLRMLEKYHSQNNGKQSVAKQISSEPTETVAPAATPADEKPSPDKGSGEPFFIDTISGLTNETKVELKQLNLTTPEAISAAPDKALLSVKGIGPARLKSIRALCAETKR
jgi:hypothetical protein